MGSIRALKADEEVTDSLGQVRPLREGELTQDTEITRFSPTRAATTFASGFNEGLANVAGFPVDAVNSLLSVTGISTADDPVGGSASIRQFMKTIGIPDIQAQTLVERFLRRTGEEIGAEVPGLGVLGAVAKGKRAGGIFGDIIKRFREAPLQTGAVETLQAGAGGAGAAAARETLPKRPEEGTLGQVSGTLAEMVGQVGGSLTIGSGADVIKGLARKIRTELAPFTKAGGGILAGQAIEGAATQPEDLIKRIREGTEQVRETLGVTPTTAQATQDPGLLALERGVSRQTPQAKGRLEDIVTEQRRAVRGKIEEGIPQGRGEAVAETMEGEINRVKRNLDAQLREANKEVADLLEKGKGTRPPEELNRVVRERLLEVEDAAEADASKLFDAVDPRGNITGRTLRIKDVADEIVESASKAERPESVPEVVRILSRGGTPTGEQVFGNTEPLTELMGLRSRITDDVRSEVSQIAPNRRAIARLTKLKQAVDDTIVKDIPEAGEAYAKAREFFRTEVAERFRQGAPAKILQRGRLGEVSAVPESATISRFFKKGTGAKEAADDFKRSLGADAQAKESLSEAVIQDFGEFSFKADGTFDRVRADRWIAGHRAALKEFPDIENKILAITKKGGAAAEVRDQVELNIQRLDKSSARFFLNAEPDNAVRGILGSKNPTKELADAVFKVKASREGLRGLKRAVFDVGIKSAETAAFDEATGANFLSPNKLRQFFSKNTRRFVASGLYSQKEIDQINRVIKAAEMVSGSTRAGLTGGSDTAANLQATSAFEIAGRMAGARFGRVVGAGTIQTPALFAKIGGRIGAAFSRNEARGILQEALFNPEVATDLLRPLNKTNTKFMEQRLRAHLANLGPEALGTRAESQTGFEAEE